MLAISSAAGASDHLYTLNGTLADSLGGPALVDHGGSLGPTSYSFGPNQGLTMNVALGGVYTIDMVMTFDVHGGWQKIIDFSNLALDYGMYTVGNQWNFYNVAGFSNNALDGQPARLTITRDSSANVTVYLNGASMGGFVDSSGKANFGANPANFFIDDFVTGQREAASGNVDYIATFDRALTADEVRAGVSPVPEPSSGVMLGAGLGLLALLRRRVARI